MTQELLCPLDNTPLRKWLSVPGDRRKPSEETDYQLYWCETCQYGTLHPLPTQYEEVEDFYKIDDYYTHSDQFQKKDNQKPRTFLEKLLVHIAWKLDQGTEITASLLEKYIPHQGTICDIGCGSGRLLSTCQKLGYQVYGLEPDAEAKTVAVSKGLQVKQGIAEDLSKHFQEQFFDGIVMTHVLEHCLDPISALANIKKALKPKGIFICEVPNNDCIGARWTGASWSHLGVLSHLHFFTENSLASCIEKAGFQVLSTQFRGYCRQFIPENIKIEQQAYEFFSLRNGQESLPIKSCASTRWMMLASSALASASRKYDSVSVISCLPD
ncbi:methyltransferase domain protein [Lyngbya aestuarii BL J]|uniref:Methyltransferase domain protein n=1 Tax=Lyngbya aestuarii BL J TaxID=1348334 RepID=U7QJ08_9CYAN|nr:class I SAM-dependent methyltransferase [Lyngbya aestuarii]ERT07080.1 methyltransferase domain protein [Lyngbya aestuarii BL J]